MAIDLNKPWLPFDRIGLARVAGHTGVYQLGDSAGNVLFIGMAGGRSRFGLKGELEKHLASPADATRYRTEVNTQYMSRYEELLMAYAAAHGTLPPWNVARGTARPRGKLTP